jgi:hypothetical protein
VQAVCLVFLTNAIQSSWRPGDQHFALGALIMVAAGMLTAFLRQLLVPLLGILLKWVIIGKYRAGVYPTFSGYYLRWWLVDQLLMLGGRGCFGWHKYASGTWTHWLLSRWP